MTIFIPTPLRPHAGGQDTVEVSAGTIADALAQLTQAHPELQKHLFTGEGKIRAFVNLYLNDEDVRYLPAKEATAVSAADTLSIIPSIAGGQPGLAVRASARAALDFRARQTATPTRELEPWQPQPKPSPYLN